MKFVALLLAVAIPSALTGEGSCPAPNWDVVACTAEVQGPNCSNDPTKACSKEQECCQAYPCKKHLCQDPNKKCPPMPVGGAACPKDLQTEHCLNNKNLKCPEGVECCKDKCHKYYCGGVKP